MNNKKPINVFILDDEFPPIDEFRRNGIYNSAISTDNLYHLAINGNWNHLTDLQQLIKDIVSSHSKKEGLISLLGFTTPTQAFIEIEKGTLPDIIIYDWEYSNAPIFSPNSKNWLIQLLKTSNAFVFVYSKMRDSLPQFLNDKELSSFSERFQLLLKGGGVENSFSSEEFMLQYIIGCASKSGNIKISGIELEFTSNNYLKHASDIFYLQRILGSKYVLDQLKSINFSIDVAEVEKILNDSNLFVYRNVQKGYFISPENKIIQDRNLDMLEKTSYLEVVKNYSLNILETILSRGILYI